jgi:type I restriction enzyme S subunit
MNLGDTISLGELCEKFGGKIQTGPFGSQLHEYDYTEVGIPVIMPKDISGNSVDESSVARISEEMAKDLSKHKVKKGDIVFPRRGEISKRAYIKENQSGFLCGTGCIKITFPESGICTKYLNYYLSKKDVIEWLEGNAVGATMKNLSGEILKKLPVLHPPLPIQRRIASILSAYDDLIENNLKRKKLLEELAQRTYEEWFVKFRINGEQLPVDEKTGLPVGWERLRLENCINNFDNKRKPLAKLVREERRGTFPYYGAADIIDYIDYYIFDGRYLLIGEDGTVITPRGVAMLQLVEGKFWVSNHAHVVTGNGKISTEFIYCFLNQYPISQHITGAAQPKISQMNLNRIEVIIGTDPIMEEFNIIVQSTINQIFNIKYQIKLLKESRDILLPRLMNGKIKVE